MGNFLFGNDLTDYAKAFRKERGSEWSMPNLTKEQ